MEARIPSLKKGLPVKLLILLISVYLLAILQDYIYSQLKSTGFFLSESALYNLYWVFFVPILLLYFRLLKYFQKVNRFVKLLITISFAFILALVHAYVFTGFFTVVSSILYDQPHRFGAMLKTILSNQFYLSVIIYAVFPFVVNQRKELSESAKPQLSHLLIKDGLKTERIHLDHIIYIKTDRPYIAIVTLEKKYLQKSSLDAIIKELEVNVFIRVHRSVIINMDHVHLLKSRKNGDFDAVMTNGDEVRLSRHYRNAWEELLHKA